MRAALLALLAVVTSRGTAHADRPIHGSVGFGGALLLTGDQGDRNRLSAELDIEPGGRFDTYGALVALRAFDRQHAGLLCVGLMYEAAAARPRLVIDLHADLGVDLDGIHLVAGGGVRTVLGIIGPLGVALDTGAYVVLAGSQDTRLAFMGETSIVARW
jgi:hypothetical protein